MNLIWRVKFLYFILFYNTNFFINTSLLLVVSMPITVFLWLSRTLTIGDILQLISWIFLSSFWYITVYLINDKVDSKKDKYLKIYKQSIVSKYNFRSYERMYMFWLLIILAILWTTTSVIHIILFIGYLISILTLALLHSYISKIKKFTIILERFTRIIFPFLALFVINHNNPWTKDYLFVVLFFCPLILLPWLELYLRDKLKHQSSKKFLLILLCFYYLFYYMFLALGVYTIKLNILFFSVWVLFVYRILTYFLAKNIKFWWLWNRYHDTYNTSRQLVVIDFVVTSILYLFIFTKIW